MLLSALLLLSWGCVHRIHVTPAPSTVSPAAIAQSLQIVVPFLALEGADHRPGITLLDWPAQDLRSAAINYIQSRRSFASVSDKPADLTLSIKAWLTMRSRGDYHYRLRLESALGPSSAPSIKSYLVEKEIDWVGCSVDHGFGSHPHRRSGPSCTRRATLADRSRSPLVSKWISLKMKRSSRATEGSVSSACLGKGKISQPVAQQGSRQWKHLGFDTSLQPQAATTVSSQNERC